MMTRVPIGSPTAWVAGGSVRRNSPATRRQAERMAPYASLGLFKPIGAAVVARQPDHPPTDTDRTEMVVLWVQCVQWIACEAMAIH